MHPLNTKLYTNTNTTVSKYRNILCRFMQLDMGIRLSIRNRDPI